MKFWVIVIISQIKKVILFLTIDNFQRSFSRKRYKTYLSYLKADKNSFTAYFDENETCISTTYILRIFSLIKNMQLINSQNTTNIINAPNLNTVLLGLLTNRIDLKNSKSCKLSYKVNIYKY